ncbi:MAG: hypothetical protein CL940_12145 [Deltaproteobacteria bacterium]|nr:hypothetical protein [Deltaproteobacteria bacterium]
MRVSPRSVLLSALIILILGACSDSGSSNDGAETTNGGFSSGNFSFEDGQTQQDLDATVDTKPAEPDADIEPSEDAGDLSDDTVSVPETAPAQDTANPADTTQDTAPVDTAADATADDTSLLGDSGAVTDTATEDATTAEPAQDGWTEVDTGQDDACAWTEVDAGSDAGCAWTEEDTGDDDDCPVDLQQIFVISNANWLLRFEPSTLNLVPLGMVECPAGGATPFSMAVDQEGFAWILYSNGSLWKVNTGDVSCQSTSFVSGQQGFTMFGMGFTADGPTTNTETLFISGGSMSSFTWQTGNLGSVALPAMMVSSIATFPVGPGSPELTGTRFGDLWGFFAMSTPSHVSKINKQTAALEKTWPLPNNLQSPEAWAFAHWGGDFYLFFKPQGSLASGAFHLDGLTGVTTEVVPNMGHTITGAGVSICAPAQ